MGQEVGSPEQFPTTPKNLKIQKDSLFWMLQVSGLNPVLQEHMHGEDWLNVTKFKNIEFSFSNLKIISTQKHSVKAEAEGKMTIRNITLKMTVPVELTYLEGMLEKRNKIPGDLLIVRSKFSVRRDDFGIRPGEYLDKVANEIDISINLAGASPF